MNKNCQKYARSKRYHICIIPLLAVVSVVLWSASIRAELLELTHVPPYGSTDNLTGRVHGVDPSLHMVAVYICLDDMGWWTKPYLPCSGVPISSDSSWEADITTAQDDIYASAVCAFLIPSSLECPSVAGEDDLPDTLFRMCVDAACSTRMGRTILFSGYEWDVRRGHAPSEPDSNYFSDSTGNVWVDGQDRLHLKVTVTDGKWQCSEINLRQPLGYGTYVFQTEGKVGDLDQNVVLGMFIYDSDAWQVNNREMDIEFSRWGDSTYPNAQFTVQPWDTNGNTYRWIIPVSVRASTHSFLWTSDSIRFESARGLQSSPPFDSVLDGWTYTKKSGIPEPGNERVTLNLWLFESVPPSDGIEPELVITSFKHLAPTAAQEHEVVSAVRPGILQNVPNPFRDNTVVAYEVNSPGRVTISVLDASGRTVRTLVDERRTAGSYCARWDGLDGAGNRVDSGVYFCRLEAGQARATGKMVLIR